MDTRDAAAGRSTPPGAGVPDPGQRDATALELGALRERLRVVEAALDLPARPGRPAPPSLPALLARVVALERRAGMAPARPPLPRPGAAARADREAPPRSPRSRRPAWRERGPGLLATALALALCAWLLRPLPGHVAPASARGRRPRARGPGRRRRPGPGARGATRLAACCLEPRGGRGPGGPPHGPLAVLRRDGRRLLRPRRPGPGPDSPRSLQRG
jgi:hypothetical protein